MYEKTLITNGIMYRSDTCLCFCTNTTHPYKDFNIYINIEDIFYNFSFRRYLIASFRCTYNV